VSADLFSMVIAGIVLCFIMNIIISRLNFFRGRRENSPQPIILLYPFSAIVRVCCKAEI